MSKHDPVVEIYALTRGSLRDAHGQLKYSWVGFTHFHLAGRYERIKTVMKPKFLNSIVVEFFPFIVDRYDTKTSIFFPFLQPRKHFG